MLSNAVTPHLVILGQHKAVLRRAARELKYSGHRDLAQVLGTAIAQGVPSAWHVQAVSAVPMHASRQRQHHFNHAEVLARCVAAELGVPYQDCLQRTRHTAQQAKLSGQERLGNLIGAFSAQRSGVAVNGQATQPLLLIDDVMSTGSTLRACRDALAEGGINQVFYGVITR